MKTLSSWVGPRRARLVLFFFFIGVTSASAGTVTGTVHNGTSGNKPVSGVDVLLIQLQGGMQVAASTKTDAQGVYRFDNPGIGGGPMLIRAVYKGVFFHQPLVPGTPNVDVTIYEPTSNAKGIEFPLRLLVFQPNADKLMVGEEFSIQNNTNPPSAYYKQDGNFEFTIPQGAELDQVSTTGPSGMPVKQGTIDKGKGRYAIAYAFQPGQNSVRISYIVPYSRESASIKETSPYDAQRVMLVAPPPMQVSSPGFSSQGTEQGYNVFAKDSIKAGTAFEVAVSGTAPPPSEASGPGSPDEANGRDSGAAETTVLAAPARLGDEKWILLGGMAAIFAVGVGLLLRKQPRIEVAVPAPPPASTSKGRKAKRAAQAAQEKPAPATAPANPATVEKVDREVNSNLDSLKDTLLRIELKRQAGTISDEEYALERGRAEQLLRDLVQG